MKKIIVLLAGVLMVFTACKESEPNTVFIPGISFLDSYFEIAKGGDKVLTVAIDDPFVTETRIQVEITGGELGVDYTLDDGNEIVIEAGKRTAEFKIGVPLAITESKVLTVKMQNLPKGYNGGRFPVVKLKTTTEPTLSFSFSDPRVTMYGSTRAIAVALYDKVGTRIRQTENVRIKVVPSEASTAVLGTHYEFLDGKDYVEIKAGQFEGYVTIKSLLYEEGKNTIVLACGEPNNYYNGNVPFVTVILPKSIEEGLIGSWKGLKWTSPLKDYIASWGLTPADTLQMFNSISAEDIITFNADKTMTVSMSGRPLGNFFRNCTWSIAGTERIVIGTEGIRPIRIDAPKCLLSVVNYSFSNSAEELQPGNIKLYITYEIEHGDMLNIFISEGDYNYENAPAPFFWGYEPLKYTFVRVEENDE